MEISKISRKYTRQQLFLTAGLCLLALVAVQVWALDIVVPIVVSVVFTLIVSYSVGYVWRLVAKRSPESLTTFYTAVSGFRLLAALATMLGYYLVCGKSTMLVFFLVFMVFYFVSLAHHSVFFAKVANRS